MAYNSKNQDKRDAYIYSVYKAYKDRNSDIPDTKIQKNILPKHNIFISYRTLQYIVNGRNYRAKRETGIVTDTNQLKLFG